MSLSRTDAEDLLYREAPGTIHGFASMRKALPSAAKEVERALMLWKALLAQKAA